MKKCDSYTGKGSGEGKSERVEIVIQGRRVGKERERGWKYTGKGKERERVEIVTWGRGVGRKEREGGNSYTGKGSGEGKRERVEIAEVYYIEY